MCRGNVFHALHSRPEDVQGVHGVHGGGEDDRGHDGRQVLEGVRDSARGHPQD
jgi:hypothetical protein